jgi:hypothetical protein
VRNYVITEARIREIIQEEIAIQQLLEEGFLDSAKDAIKKLSVAVTNRFKEAADKWANVISEKINMMQTIPPEILTIVNALEEGKKSTGESIELDETLKLAQSLSKENPLASAEEELSGPIYAKAKELKEMYVVLSDNSYVKQRKNLHEAGIITGAGIGLAIIGGLPLLFKGLTKLAVYLKAEKLASIFEKAEHVTHAFEQKFIKFVIPSKLSYFVYKFLAEKGFHTAGEKEVLSYERYKSSKSEQKTAELIYKALLIYFAFQGLAGALKAGASLLGFVEGTATTVKGIELAKGFADVRKIVSGA